MRTRTLSALAYAAVFLGCAWLGGATWAAFVALLSLVGAREAAALVAGGGGARAQLGIVLVAALLLPPLWLLAGPGAMLPALLLVVLAAGASQLARPPETRSTSDYLATLALPLAVSLPLAHLVGLRQLAAGEWRAGPAWLLVVLALVWTNDSAAYLVGRAIGRRPFFPSVSPKKTLEGALGGLLACGLLGAALPRLAAGVPPLPGGQVLASWQGLLLGLLLAALGSAGDLAESFLKRQAGVKDSGKLIPGHGGILDRVDSLIWVVPVAYHLVAWLAGGS